MEEEGEASLTIWEKDHIKEWEPADFKLEENTVWDFPKRGTWAVHQSDYRGNWPPQLARNLILQYTKPKGIVADLFVGGGTTLMEAWLLGRRSVGIDINPFAVKMTNARLDELERKTQTASFKGLKPKLRPFVYEGNSLDAGMMFKELGLRRRSIDLICAHPPYLNVLKYTETIQGDLSHISDVSRFILAFREIAEGVKEWLKPGGVFAVLIGDVRRRRRVVPLGHRLLNECTEAGYELMEIIIKTQNRDRTNYLWANRSELRYLIAHEYLYLFS